MKKFFVGALVGVLFALAVPVLAQTTGCTITGTAALGPFRLPITGTCSELQGPVGPTGPAGATGPAGPPGPASVALFVSGTGGSTTITNLPTGNYVAGQLAWDTMNGILFLCDTAGTQLTSHWVAIGVKLANAAPWPRSPQYAMFDIPADGTWLDKLPHPSAYPWLTYPYGWQREIELNPAAAPNTWRWAGPAGTYRGTFSSL